jgi:hypothetical protein
LTEPASPAPAPSGTPFVSDLMRLIRVPFSPAEVFTEIRGRPPFWMPWLIISIGFAVLQWFASPFQNRARELALEQAGRAAQDGAGAAMAIAGVLMSPVIVLVMTAITAGILYVLMQALGGEEASYKGMLSVVIHSWPVGLIQQALVVVVLRIRGLDSIRSMSDSQVTLGLDVLLPAEAEVSAFLRAIMGGIGPLQIWGVAITAVGLAVMSAAPRGKAWTAALISFGIGLLIAASLASAFSGMGG